MNPSGRDLPRDPENWFGSGVIEREPSVKITESTKYVVKDRANHRAITNGASRTNAHAVRRLLGDRFYVFNRITKRESR
jgi:hypothetical protein